MLITILAAVVVLGVLILVHELGHFWAAKAVDIEVPRFSIGWGSKIWGFRWGETEYVISWLPVGGYVKMAGMGEEEAMGGIEGGTEEEREPSPRDFDAKPLWARALTISAGVIMNFLFAVAAFAAIAGIWGIAPEPDARIGDVVEEELPASAQALATAPRDVRILAVAGADVESWEEFRRELVLAREGPTPITFADGSELIVELPEATSEREAVVQSLAPVLDVEPVLGDIVSESPAEASGLRSGDRVLQVDGQPVESFQELVSRVERHPGEPVEVRVRRDGAETTVSVVPEIRELAGEGDTLRYGRIGAAAQRRALTSAASGLAPREAGPVAATVYGFEKTWEWTVTTVGFAGALVTGRTSARNLGGPIAIGQISGEVARAGMRELLWFMAVLSVNLAILNLLPIPILDGGHLAFLAIEGVRGREVSVETRIRWSQVGLLLVAALMVFAIGNDILRLFQG